MKVFLGGTCAGSGWRDELKPLLNINYFDPARPVASWTEKDAEREIEEKRRADFVLYVITPMMLKFCSILSIAEVIDDSNKRPLSTIFCVLLEDEEFKFEDSQIKSLDRVKKMVEDNGALVLSSLGEVAEFLNSKLEGVV